MRSIDKLKDIALAGRLAKNILNFSSKEIKIFAAGEGLAYSIIKNKLGEMLNPSVSFLFGPGCPACVTSVEAIDKAICIASMKDIIFILQEEYLNIPGSKQSLSGLREKSNSIRIIESPVEAVTIAGREPDKRIVFLAAGFEDAAAENLYALSLAKKKDLKNFFMLNSHLKFGALLTGILPQNNYLVNGILLSGRIFSVTGYNEYKDLPGRLKIPVVITGCEPLDILQSVYLIAKQIKEGRCETENQFTRGAPAGGNKAALNLISDYFETANKNWRSFGNIENGGYKFKKEFYRYDAEKNFPIKYTMPEESVFCEAKKVLKGQIVPYKCSAYSKLCSPPHALGAPMAAKDGICSLFFKLKRNN